MRKRILFYAMVFVLSLVMIPNVFAVDKATVDTITDGGEVNDVDGVTVVTYDSATLKIAPKQEASDHVGERPEGFGWLGIKVTAPESVDTENASYYTVNTLGQVSDIKKYSDFKDDEVTRVISLWSGINFEVINAAIMGSKPVTMEYHFNWDGNEDFEQIVRVEIEPENVILQTESGVQAYPVSNLGTVEPILPTEFDLTGNKTNFVNITYPNVFELDWVKSDQDGIVRPKDGWWIGVRFSKEGSTANAKFKYRVNGGEWSTTYVYDDEKDEGKEYVSVWALIDEEIIKDVDEVVYEYAFDWDNDGTYEQIVTQTIPVKNITLLKDGKTIYPEVKDEEPTVTAPNTLDNVSIYLVFGLLSVIGVTTLGYVFKKKLEN